MFYPHTAPLAAFLLRVSLGVMYLTHSLVLKVGTFGMAGTVQFFESQARLPGKHRKRIRGGKGKPISRI